MPTGSFRSVYSANTRGAEEIVVDEIAKQQGKDPAAFRREFLKTDRQRAVLAKVVKEGSWGRSMPAGFAQGIAFHDEYKSCTACLVEIDARDPQDPRVTRATIAVDVGLPDQPARPAGADARRAHRRHRHRLPRRPARRRRPAARGQLLAVPLRAAGRLAARREDLRAAADHRRAGRGGRAGPARRRRGVRQRVRPGDRPQGAQLPDHLPGRLHAVPQGTGSTRVHVTPPPR